MSSNNFFDLKRRNLNCVNSRHFIQIVFLRKTLVMTPLDVVVILEHVLIRIAIMYSLSFHVGIVDFFVRTLLKKKYITCCCCNGFIKQ